MKKIERLLLRAKKISKKQLMFRFSELTINPIYHQLKRKRIIRNISEDFESFSSDFNLLSRNQEWYIENCKEFTNIIEEADKMERNIFNLLGTNDVQFNNKIPWNFDFKTNFSWPNGTYYKDINLIDLNNRADVKIPWELSRFHHLFTLGKAYFLTNNEKYALKFKEQIEDWIAENPYEESINWTSTMDVSIRAVNWIAVYSFFKNSPSINSDFWKNFNSSLYQHGIYIFKNLENKGYFTGNHYLSNIVGLIWLGLYFKGYKYKNILNNHDKWLEKGLKEIENEMIVQTNTDGTNYEASTSYHRLVTEFFLFTAIICKKYNVNLSEFYNKKLEDMVEFIYYITKPNGNSPIIGDADDGRLLILSSYYSWDRRDFNNILIIAGIYFNRNDFLDIGMKYGDDVLWLHSKSIDNSENTGKVARLTSKKYEHGGYYILRNSSVYVSIRCGELSFRGEGTHSHNDQLSIELNVGGKDFFIDPGTYTYTSDYIMRNFFRSTRMHNTVQINNKEQNNFEEKELFYMAEETFSECLTFDENEFSGYHKGYYSELGVYHQRKITLEKKCIFINDTIFNESSHNKNGLLVQTRFILDPAVEILSHDDKTIYLKNEKVEIKLWNLHPQSNYSIDSTVISKAYGVLESSKVITFESLGEGLDFKIEMVL
ncbi:alginate lyase family protein [Exiguobacterium sp. SH5S4]|uniref:alginate lyase family protein n=1 Tax=Exiguobacterium sp. SH5S4 TaxID=2510961 RepID=UPI00103E22A1|nr:alginate lyase family protein [Exiguobacterium sp. SH5S4]TCI25137.1 alginate lyase family protein [Exiguobacterium sp. SH5S4]